MNSIRVTVSDTAINERNGTSAKTGKPYKMREQTASIETARFRMPLRLMLGDQQPAYAPGVYELDVGNSIEVDRFGGLSFGRSLQLVRISEPARKAG